MTSNKAQGQTVQKIGISLQHPLPSHGQLYVAMSWVGAKHAIKIDAKKANDQVYIDNLVFPEVLQ